MVFDLTQVYPSLVALLFAASGGLMLAVDTRLFRKQGMFREERWSRVMGWINVGAGAAMWVGVRIAERWLW